MQKSSWGTEKVEHIDTSQKKKKKKILKENNFNPKISLYMQRSRLINDTRKILKKNKHA